MNLIGTGREDCGALHWQKKNAVDITNFPGGPPPEYSSDSKTLNFADRTGYGVFILI